MQSPDEAVNRKLSTCADIIEAICYDIDAPVRIDNEGIIVLGSQVRFIARPIKSRQDFRELQAHLGVNLKRFNYDHRATKNLKKIKDVGINDIISEFRLPGQARVTVELNGGALTFDLDLKELIGPECFFPLSIDELPMPHKGYIPIGRTLEGEEVIFCPDEITHCHVLVAGQTGSGKTVLGNTILCGLVRAYTPDEMSLLLASGKPEDIELWRGTPHLIAEPTYHPDGAFAMLKWLVDERERRSGKQDKGPRIFMYIGEIAELVRMNTTEFSSLIEVIMRLGRSEKISIIAATQHGRSDQIGSAISRAQFPLVISGRLRDATAAYVALGIGQTNAERLPGRGALVTNNGTRFQAAFSADALNTRYVREVINGLRKIWEPGEHINLPQIQKHAIDTVAGDADVCTEWMKENSIEEISTSTIQREMKWGYLRASRVFQELNSRGMIGERQAGNKPARVLWKQT